MPTKNFKTLMRRVATRSILTATLLAATILFAAPITSVLLRAPEARASDAINVVSAIPDSCAHCTTDRNACNAACNGNAECLSICQAEYQCCLITCHGGSCRKPEKENAAAANLSPIRLSAAAMKRRRSLTKKAHSTMSPCTDECQSDYEAQRYACLNMQGTWQEVLQCYNDAKAARDLCLAGCQ